MARRVHQGERDFTAIESESAAKLERAGLAVEYLAIRREEDLAIPQQNEANLRVLAAVRCGQTRLIDNVSVIEVGIYDC
jgi:pantoate--beta-alanine ligase